MNKSDCSTCDHRRYPDGGHCYMFRQEPESTCGLWAPDPDKAAGVRRSHILGGAAQELVEGGVSLAKALDAVLKAYDHRRN